MHLLVTAVKFGKTSFDNAHMWTPCPESTIFSLPTYEKHVAICFCTNRTFKVKDIQNGICQRDGHMVMKI